jgi:pSer/pThr/pTyr-binding forkhead associated (FHA) protein
MLENEDLVVEDMGSTNGVSTPAGELRAGMRCALRAGDVLGLGRTVIEVLGRQTDWISSDVMTPDDTARTAEVETPAPLAAPVEAVADPSLWSDPSRSVATVVDTGILLQRTRPARQARLTLLGPGTRETVDINASPFRVGRTPGPLVALVVRHDRLSSPHIELRDTGSSFEVVDLGSRNGTWVDGARLQEHHPHTLGRHALLRMGKLAALFTAEADTDVDSAVWEHAAAVLVQEGILTNADVERARAATTSRRNLGELLLVDPRSSLTVERWVHAADRARTLLTTTKAAPPAGRKRAAWDHGQELVRGWWTRLWRSHRRDR